jgi:hypothetical protein
LAISARGFSRGKGSAAGLIRPLGHAHALQVLV